MMLFDPATALLCIRMNRNIKAATFAVITEDSVNWKQVDHPTQEDSRFCICTAEMLYNLQRNSFF